MKPGDIVCYIYPASVGRSEDLYGIIASAREGIREMEYEVLWLDEEDRDTYETWYGVEDLQLIRSIDNDEYTT